jgi:shikimate kinase
MKNIYLVGFMGTGKSFVGRILARKLGIHFFEMDHELERRAGKTITQIFKEDGEAVFRVMETNLLCELSFKSGMVVSCGGGVVCNEGNIVMMKKSGVIVNLFSSAEKIYARTKADKERPLLQVEDPLSKINELLTKRAPFYARADYQVRSEDETPEEVAEAIVKILKDAR